VEALAGFDEIVSPTLATVAEKLQSHGRRHQSRRLAIHRTIGDSYSTMCCVLDTDCNQPKYVSARKYCSVAVTAALRGREEFAGQSQFGHRNVVAKPRPLLHSGVELVSGRNPHYSASLELTIPRKAACDLPSRKQPITWMSKIRCSRPSLGVASARHSHSSPLEYSNYNPPDQG
jgi:hypothetical protein